MVIYGTALLALCTLVGVALGEALGAVLGVKANIGGVGIAMVLLIAARGALERAGLLDRRSREGLAFWAMLYIPIVVAMAATQNVRAALDGRGLVVISAVTTVATCFTLVALIGRLGRR